MGVHRERDWESVGRMEVLACEAERAHLLSADLACGQRPDPAALMLRLTPRHMTLPKDVAVAHPSLESFDALLGAKA